MPILIFLLKFHWSLSLRILLIINQHQLRQWYFALSHKPWSKLILTKMYDISLHKCHWSRHDESVWIDCMNSLTHWGQVTHISVSKLTIIGPDNGLSPDRRQAIIWTNAGIFLIGPLGTNFSEILIEIQTFSFKKMHLKMSSGKWRPSCLGLNVLRMAI